ncbi:unnamed protein product [Schistosoma mattheei]|uniref:Uncharacterized protein n=1 Tax=Schistosoma mattheei TaxID=31246 RepID=A0A183PVY8_9TREM|nr:unnamed protein product [Schistosoma mattheei]
MLLYHVLNDKHQLFLYFDNRLTNYHIDKEFPLHQHHFPLEIYELNYAYVY